MVDKKESDGGKTESQALRDKWVKRIQREIESKTHKAWRKQAERSEKQYLEDKDSDKPPGEFPIWWSTVQITHAAIFANAPKPDVRKRYNDGPKTDDRIAQAIERGISFTVDTTYFGDNADRSVNDFLVAGLGAGKVELDTEFAEGPVISPIDNQPILGEDSQPLMQKVIKAQTLKLRHFHWSKFGWEPGKDWDSCDWVRFRHDMTCDEMEEQFGIDEEKLTGNNDMKAGGEKYQQTFEVDEIWDRKTKRQLFICDKYEDVLEINDDPLKLSGFYPCPKPCMLNIKGDEFVPKPDYCFIEVQCDNINRTTARINALTKNIKDVGFYDQQLGELAGLMDARDNELIPLKNLKERLQSTNGVDFTKVVCMQDNTTKVAVLRELMVQRDSEKNTVYETLGIADIVRGASQASETAAAQNIKAQWANVRIGPKVKALASYFRETFRIMAEIMAEHFTPEQLQKMTGMQLTQEELAIMKNDLSRVYAIDVETDSTIAADDAEERGQRLEMVKTLTDYLNAYLPLAQQNLMPADMVKQTLLFVIRSFKYGRQMEDAITALPDNVAQLQQLQTQLQQAQQQMEQQAQQMQQMQGQNQQMQQALGKVDQQKSAVEAAKAQAEIANDTAMTGADVDLKRAQTANTYKDAMTPDVNYGRLT